jgi:hypothetical protein
VSPLSPGQSSEVCVRGKLNRAGLRDVRAVIGLSARKLRGNIVGSGRVGATDREDTVCKPPRCHVKDRKGQKDSLRPVDTV